MSAVAISLAAAALLGSSATTLRPLPPVHGDAPDPEEELEGPVFDDARVQVDERFRWELRAGIAMPEQASRLRITNPAFGAGVSHRPFGPRVRVDGGYLFTWANQGTSRVSVFNSHHALNARAHWVVPAGPTWFSIGGGPAVHLTTAHPRVNGASQPASVAFDVGVNLAGGVETQVADRLFRIEAGAQSRGLRVDLFFLVGVGL